MKFNENCVFEQKVLFETLTKYYTPQPKSPPGAAGAKNANFGPKCIHSAKLGIFALFATLGPKGHLLRKSAPWRPHAADAYKTNGKLMKMEPLLAQKRFFGEKEHSGAQNRFLGPKGEFWVKMGFWAPKAIYLCKLRKS